MFESYADEKVGCQCCFRRCIDGVVLLLVATRAGDGFCGGGRAGHR